MMETVKAVKAVEAMEAMEAPIGQGESWAHAEQDHADE
jgi:hypothetical protein